MWDNQIPYVNLKGEIAGCVKLCSDVVEVFLTTSHSSGMSHCPVFFGTRFWVAYPLLCVSSLS